MSITVINNNIPSTGPAAIQAIPSSQPASNRALAIAQEKLALKNQISRSLGPENITFDNPAYSNQERLGILKQTVKNAERLLWLEENYPECKQCLSTAHFYLAKAYFWYWRNQGPVSKLASLNHFAIKAKEHYNESIEIASKVIRKRCEEGARKNQIAANADYLNLAIAYRELAKLEYALNESDLADTSVEKSTLAFQSSGEIKDNTGLEEIDKRHENFNRNYHRQSNVLNLELSLDASQKASKAILSSLKVGGLEVLRRFLFEKIKIVELLSNNKNKSPNNPFLKPLIGLFAKIKAFKVFYILEFFEVANLFFEGLAASESTAGLSRAYEGVKRNIYETVSNWNWQFVKNIQAFNWP